MQFFIFINQRWSTVKPGFKPVPPQHYFEFAAFFGLASAEKERQIQNNAVEELIWIQVLLCKHHLRF